MKHKVDNRIFYCQMCGKPLTEIFDDNHYQCEGIEGYVHPEFVRAQLNFIKHLGGLLQRKPDGKQKEAK